MYKKSEVRFFVYSICRPMRGTYAKAMVSLLYGLCGSKFCSHFYTYSLSESSIRRGGGVRRWVIDFCYATHVQRVGSNDAIVFFFARPTKNLFSLKMERYYRRIERNRE